MISRIHIVDSSALVYLRSCIAETYPLSPRPAHIVGEVAIDRPRLSHTPGAVRHAGHQIGQDTREVLREVLGMEDAEIDAMARAGVIALQPAATQSATMK